MSEVHQASSGGKGGDPPAALDPLDPRDAAAFRAWLYAVRVQVDDLHAAGEDATRALGRRALGRATARAAIREAHGALRLLLAAAEPEAQK